jgi:hypothetical protein
MKRSIWLCLACCAAWADAAPGSDPHACSLLEPAEVQAALGTDVVRAQPQETWICNWVLAGGELVAQLLLVPAPKATFAEYEAEIADQMGPGHTKAVAGVGEWASWTLGSMLYVKTGDNGLQVTPYRNGSPEKAAELAKKAIARLPR